ncbi:dolichyl-diphosphooligosaccharide-protein glycosyltransferase subunit 4A [Capsicum annuum]
MLGMTVLYDRSLWSDSSSNPAIRGCFNSPRCPFFKLNCGWRLSVADRGFKDRGCSGGSNTYIDVEVMPENKSILMIDDQDLGFFANFLGIFIFVLVVAYHYVMADPKYEGN